MVKKIIIKIINMLLATPLAFIISYQNQFDQFQFLVMFYMIFLLLQI